ncbi:MAG: hypothetical protein IJN75_04380 [Clostridia bacterium]|nr:hypothetical protein [Clostridia bacterium]
MIDYENEIFTSIAEESRDKHPGIIVKGEYVRSPAEFPMLAISEFQNVMIDELMDSTKEEKYAGLGYRIQVFSNKQSGKKAEAKAIFATADAKIRSMGFRRKTYAPTPEIYDSTIFSIVATYEAIIDTNGVVYKR